jgi:lipase chaperone LimK
MAQLQTMLVAILLSLVVGFASGWKVNGWKYAAERKVAESAAAEAMEATAKELAKIEVRNVTIKQQMETVVRENVVYRDCQHTPDGLRLVNEALSGKSAGGSKLPGTSPAK